MKRKFDYNEIAKIEKAIAEKYGKKAIINPMSQWSEEKEKKYQEETKNKFLKEKKEKKRDKSEEGFLVKERLINERERVCSVCEVYSFDSRDDVYMNKFQCCRLCYIQYVEDREERWQNGWRPNKNKDQKNES